MYQRVPLTALTNVNKRGMRAPILTADQTTCPAQATAHQRGGCRGDMTTPRNLRANALQRRWMGHPRVQTMDHGAAPGRLLGDR